MFWKKEVFRNGRQRNRWAILTLTLSVALFSIPQPVHSKEKESRRRLPPAPDTGSPEEDFSAGGTRDSGYKDVCGAEEISYLLGNRNREFTTSAYPTFWFHIPNTTNKTAQMKFVLTQLETGKKIYERPVAISEESSIVGVDLPSEKRYALSLKTNYAWSLEVNCAGTNEDAEIALEGWVTRLPLQSKLQNKLATISEADKHTVYLKHNLLYDALTGLAQRHIARPNDLQIETAWNQLLIELGWQDLIEQESASEPYILDMRVSSEN